MTTLSTGQRQLQQIERSRALADAMQQQAISIAPIQHPLQGLAKLAQAWASSRINTISRESEDRITKEQNEALAQVLAPNVTNIQGPGLPATTDTLPGDPEAIEFFKQFETDQTGPFLDAGAREIGARNALGPTIGPELDELIRRRAQEAEPAEIGTAAIPGQKARVETPKTQGQLLEALVKVRPDLAEQVMANTIQHQLTKDPETTSDITEYHFAQTNDRFPGSFQDWLQTVKPEGTLKANPGYMWVEGKEGREMVFIPGGPADPSLAENTVEAATKAAAVDNALYSLDKLNTMLFDENGSVNRSMLWAMNMPGGGVGHGATANAYMLTAIEAALRAESGAAVPDTEVVRAAKRFRPKNTDFRASTVRAKLALLDRFLSGAYSRFNKDGRFDPKATAAAVNAAADEYEKNGTIAGEPAYKAAHEAMQKSQPQEYAHGATANNGALTYDHKKGWVNTENFNVN